jgi:hypothetical protein
MKARTCFALLLVTWSLVCGLSAFAQTQTINANVDLVSTDPVNAPWLFSYKINGKNALSMSSAGVNGTNLFVGRNAGANNNNNNLPNTFVGSFAGYQNTGGGSNAFFGYAAGYNNTNGSSNTFSGYQSGYNNTNGWSNTFTGYWTGFSNTTGKENVFTGYYSGQRNSTGGYNTFVGGYAGYDNTTGSHNIILGDRVSSGNGNNNIYVGNHQVFGGESNTLRLGSPLYQDGNCTAFPCGISAAYIAGVYGTTINSGKLVCIDSTGKLGTSCTIGLAAQEDLIRSQAQRIEDLELRLSRLEALLAK